MTHSRTLLVLCLAALCGVLWAGCGGGGGTPATTPEGEVIRTAGGSEVTAEAHNHWREAIAMFERHDREANAWNEANCQSTIAKFNQANQAQGGRFTEAIYMMGVVSGRCRNDEQALTYYRQALETNQEYCGARVGVALGDMRAGRTREARQHFERAIQQDNQCTAAYVNLAILQRQNANEVRDALNNLRRALAIESNYLPAFNQMALLYLEQAAGNRQMLDLAGVVCRQAQLINANYAPIYNTWGLITVRKGDIIEALRLFARARELDPSFYEAHMNFGQLTLSYRGYEDASQAFTQASTLRPQSYDALLGLGAALRGLSRFEEAEAKYRAAIQLDGARPEAYFNLGLLYQDYMGGQEAQLRQARGFFEQFTQRAANQQPFAETVENVTRRCRRRPESSSRRRRSSTPQSEWAGGCRPGRIQQIELAIELGEQLRQMQQNMPQQPAEPPAAAPAEGGGGAAAPAEGQPATE